MSQEKINQLVELQNSLVGHRHCLAHSETAANGVPCAALQNIDSQLLVVSKKLNNLVTAQYEEQGDS